MIKLVNLYYKEKIGNPSAPDAFTEEYKVLARVTEQEAADYITAFEWIRSVWRTEAVS